ncbi:MAG: hypothetical protein HZC37_03795 [Burkholderiales bacterium]|nr:hypothetical protein [Burkholderiales bacterium]
MADEPTPLPPLEIPWKLASTTQPLASGEPAQTALSLFFFEPDDAALIGAFPDERIVFVKLTASVSPASIPPALSPVAAAFLGEGVPCLHLLLDLKVSAPDHAPGTVRPYFHAAAPLNRRMVQTGVVGGDAYEGEAESLAIGKSGTQMRESLRSHATTTTAGASAGLSLGPVSIGGGVSRTSTDLDSSRAVSQVVDTTTRQAAEERRELISHTTNVENIISLLRAKYVGTPHLSFSLSPQPLTQLSVDPGDPNLWFQQLLARRSAGIEGIQEFTAVIVVPRGTGFCLNARLRRVCLLDSPPGPFEVRERFTGGLLQLNRMVQYLNRTFPAGTPLEELDIDILAGLANAGAFRRPVVELWGLRLLPQLVIASVVSPTGTGDALAAGRAAYKHFLEVWVDTLRDEYEREVARSPLERGLLFGENRFLDTCFGFAEGGEGDDEPFVVTSSTASVGPLIRVPLPRGVFDIGGSTVLARGGNGSSTRSHALETTARWNAIDQRVAGLLSNGLIATAAAEIPLKANDPALVSVLVEHWRKLPDDDPRNLGFEQAAALLKLGDAQRKALGGTGARNLAAMATALVGAARVEEHNADVERAAELFRKRRLTGPPDALKTSLSASQAASIVQGIGDVLVSGSAQPLVDAVIGAPRATGGTAAGPGGSSRKGGSRSKGKGKG